ncbi:MAG: arsenate reductase ArsC [Alphaproteobacteria bacterium]|nr:arsenate reductase ArsC [Alphaproteobacteria bacterium]
MSELPGAVLFACDQNAVRSAMAEAMLKHLHGTRIYVDSAGVRAGEPDPFAAAVMEEIGLDISQHRPKSMRALPDASFDVIVTLSPQAQHRAIEMTRTLACAVEYWPTYDPAMFEGMNREGVLAGYRQIRDHLWAKVMERFPPIGGSSP